MHRIKQHLNLFCLSLWVHLKNRGSPLLLMHNIGFISLMMQSSLPTTMVIICPSLSWMSLKSRLITCWKKDGLPYPLLPMGIPCYLPTKRMVICNYVWISGRLIPIQGWTDTPCCAYLSCLSIFIGTVFLILLTCNVGITRYA